MRRTYLQHACVGDDMQGCLRPTLRPSVGYPRRRTFIRAPSESRKALHWRRGAQRATPWRCGPKEPCLAFRRSGTCTALTARHGADMELTRQGLPAAHTHAGSAAPSPSTLNHLPPPSTPRRRRCCCRCHCRRRRPSQSNATSTEPEVHPNAWRAPHTNWPQSSSSAAATRWYGPLRHTGVRIKDRFTNMQ